MVSAAAGGRLDCLQFLHAHGCPWDLSVSRAAINSTQGPARDLAMLKWLDGQGYDHWHPSLFATAAQSNNSAVLKWLHARGIRVADATPALKAFYASASVRPPMYMFLADIGFPLGKMTREKMRTARQAYCMFHGLVRWVRSAVWDPRRRAHLAFEFTAMGSHGPELLVNLAGLPEELVLKISVMAGLQHEIGRAHV